MQKYPDIIRTVLFNVIHFGIVKGLKFPVYLYGKVKVYDFGKVVFTCPLRRGLVRIGMNRQNTSLPYTIINNTGTIEIGGRTWIHHGCRVTNSGVVSFAGNDIISHNTVVDIRTRLEFGHDVSIGYESEFIDSDMHYMVDVETRRVYPNSSPIKIGNFNWFGSHTYVKKGTVTPDYTIVASPNALLLKDYSKDIEPYSILGGSPVKVIGHGKQRVMKFKNQGDLDFSLNTNHFVELNADIDLDEYCKL